MPSGRSIGSRAAAVAALVAGACLLAGGVRAQAASDPAPAPLDPERLALARTYVRESHMDTAMRGMFGNLLRSMPALQSADPKARQLVDSLSVGMDAALPMVLDASAEAAARTFTTQELKDLVAFYGSPTGQSLMAKMPQMMQQVGPLTARILPVVFAGAEADFCRRQTCAESDRAVFRALEASLAPAAAPGKDLP